MERKNQKSLAKHEGQQLMQTLIVAKVKELLGGI